jgi:hypothetical protein
MSKFSELEIGLEEALEIGNKAIALANEIKDRSYGNWVNEERQSMFTLQEAANVIGMLVRQIQGMESAPTKAEINSQVRFTARLEVPWYLGDVKVSDLAGTAGDIIFDMR